MVRYLLFFSTFFLSSLLFSQETVNRTERIIAFHADYKIQKNCTVDITERITVYARGITIKHGIYREIPLEYAFEGGVTEVGFELTATRCDGKKVDYHTEDAQNGIRIYLGNEDTYVAEGVHTYEISYSVDHALNLSNSSFDELYWNVNGTGWSFPIDGISADVYFPKGAKVKEINGYTGSQGSSGKDYVSTAFNNHIHFEGTCSFAPGENLTFSVTWNKGVLRYPAAYEEFFYWIKTHFLWVIGGLGFILTLLYSSVTWWRYGRDPKPGTIVPQYEAPEGFSPADVAHIHNYSRGMKNVFTAQLIGLAVKGRVSIHVDDSGGLFSSKTYTIRQSPSSDWKKEQLLPQEYTFYEALFRNGPKIILVGKTYHPHLKTVQDNLSKQVCEEHGEQYMNKRFKFKARQYLFTFGLLLVGLVGYYFFGGHLGILFLFILATIVTNIVFGFLFEQPTPQGRKTMDYLLGFRLYMLYAEKERIRLMNPPSMDFEHFERNLPYAIALGVSEEWSSQFDPKVIEPHTSTGHYWYTGAMLAGFHSHSFDFSGLSSTISSAASPPSKSSGSGGGGFSGGGGGGGGGGGW